MKRVCNSEVIIATDVGREQVSDIDQIVSKYVVDRSENVTFYIPGTRRSIVKNGQSIGQIVAKRECDPDENRRQHKQLEVPPKGLSNKKLDRVTRNSAQRVFRN